MQIARLADQVLDGHPVVAPDRARMPAGPQRSALLRYLRSGTVVLAARTLLPDPLSDSDDPVVPLVYLTDGVWVWSAGVTHALQHHGLLPDVALVQRALEREVAGEVSDEQIAAALAVLHSNPADEPS